ncbi:1,4-alpha-glucan branching enzyme GlgB [Usitatibacter rugosus]|uniref:1,4-alpha-glucan branching enzyme GlgB n=1 Tax=Usitatibacter rugosus TaxID=2732067 RepID=A0A6M4GX06_9PROT|nr:1,4-alpha-glucan branching protein GlgB [Usitatibacter rugosus]QJR11034.1 1,4-alpha-glucan branching enzyme GlgB [Usitatibacter rugosus]
MTGPAPHVLTEHDIYLFREGTHTGLHHKLGCHLEGDGSGGGHFAVWAPSAQSVSVVGDWNDWQPDATPMAPRWDGSGIWEVRDAAVARGEAYKFHIVAKDGSIHQKADPYAAFCERPPATASRAWTLEYHWSDAAWVADRAARNAPDAPMSIYEVHLGSWRREREGGLPGYHEIAEPLAKYCVGLGFTHVELMPVTEHPFYGSWGYQTTGYFAPTARYGTPQDLMHFVDVMHRHGLGVILDWVPSHFPTDAHGLARFDGTHLFEHEDPRQGFHPEWSSAIFNYGRHEVRAFLLSSAHAWLERYHLDGLRVDAVASMLYLDYARKSGEWIPNPHGGKENLEAITFLRMLNESVARDHRGTCVIAEESTAWPGVTRDGDTGGLGFAMKWNMGWMHDTLRFFGNDPVHRRFHHDALTFPLWYAFNERFVMPLSHDEVVHGKGSLITRMPGDKWQKLANLRLLLGWMWASPGKKLLFMGGEIGQEREWSHERELDWGLLQDPGHAGLSQWVADLNRLMREEPSLHARDFDPQGFAWIDCCDVENSIASMVRTAPDSKPVVVVCNFTPVVRHDYRIGVPLGGPWIERLNGDAGIYGGSDVGNLGRVEAAEEPRHGRSHSIALTLPPLAALFLTPA